jgi:hypothetical protein
MTILRDRVKAFLESIRTRTAKSGQCSLYRQKKDIGTRPRNVSSTAIATWWSVVCAGSTAQRRSVKADAQNVVKIISGDKLKIDLSDQIDEAIQQQDTQKAKELSQKAEELQRKLGPEFYRAG